MLRPRFLWNRDLTNVSAFLNTALNRRLRAWGFAIGRYGIFFVRMSDPK